MSFEQFRLTYFEECFERLGEVEQHLLALEDGTADGETLHAIFRAVHSVKGGAGAFGFEALVRYAHVFETLLDEVRNNVIPASREVLAVLVRATDDLNTIVEAAEQNTTLPEQFGQESVQLMESLSAGAGHSSGATASQTVTPAADKPAALQQWKICFKPHPDLFRHANEPLLLLRELCALGEGTVTANIDAIPSLAAIDPEGAYLGWTVLLETAAGQQAIYDVFEFVLDECDLTIEAQENTTTATPAQEESVTTTANTAPPAAANDSGTPAASGGKSNAPGSIRVELDKIDRLVNMVGELVITQAMLAQQTEQLPADQFSGLVQGLLELSRHTRELQDSVMAIRAQPVKSVFARMPRLVRDLALLLEKDIKLVVHGENTEVDKTVIEQIGDPLTHLIRNCVDHGVESPAKREEAGKPKQGTIHLSAEHRSGRIVIEIRDDGAGINRPKVKQLAIDKGLIAADSTLEDEDIDNLIFLPGFSTADKISDISGRGVGMDVVKKNIQAMGGRVMVRSTPGKGSVFTLSLPLTLAVLDGMVVRVGGETYIVPVPNIVESLRPAAGTVSSVVGHGEVFSLRGQYIPLLSLAQLFGLENARTARNGGLVLLLESDDRRFGLVVDELLGQQQVVIKSLEANYDPIEGVSAATILGNGRVALILDAAGLLGLLPRQSLSTAA